MKNKGWTIDDDGELQLIEFDEDEITLDLPVDDPAMDIGNNWMLVPRMFPLVSTGKLQSNRVNNYNIILHTCMCTVFSPSMWHAS